MNKEHMRRDDLSRPDHECEEVAELLDAYSTHELVGNEKNMVELHLASCHVCQMQLRELQHFRELLTSLRVNTQHSRVDGAMTSIFSAPPFSQLVDAVMNEIVKNEEATMKQAHLSPPFQEHASTSLPSTHSMRRRTWPRSIVFLIAALCVAILASTSLVTVYSLRQSPPNSPASVMQPLIWKVQADQVSVQNSEGAFALKFMDFTPKGFRFFYTVYALNHEGISSVRAYSYLSSNPQAKISLAATVQSLGQLGASNIGVIHVQGLSRAHQIIALQILLFGRKTPAWQLAPLQQLITDPHPNDSIASFSIEQIGHPEIVWYGPVMFEEVAFFKQMASSHSASDSSYIFVRIDDPYIVKVITKAQYLAIAGQQNFF